MGCVQTFGKHSIGVDNDRRMIRVKPGIQEGNQVFFIGGVDVRILETEEKKKSSLLKPYKTGLPSNCKHQSTNGNLSISPTNQPDYPPGRLRSRHLWRGGCWRPNSRRDLSAATREWSDCGFSLGEPPARTRPENTNVGITKKKGQDIPNYLRIHPIFI